MANHELPFHNFSIGVQHRSVVYLNEFDVSNPFDHFYNVAQCTIHLLRLAIQNKSNLPRMPIQL